MKYILVNQETDRLRFRLLRQDDFHLWVNLFEDKETVRFLGYDTSLSPMDICEIWFNKVFWRYEYNSGGMNVIIDKITGAFVGQCGLLVQTIEESERLEIGYSILPGFRGQGYATEAAVKCKDFAFENNFAESLISIIHFENKSSEKVALKNGMSFEKQINLYKSFPVKIFKINKSDWQTHVDFN